MSKRHNINGYQVADALYQFVNQQVLPGLSIDAATFWPDAMKIFDAFAPRNKALLAKRDQLQNQLDHWHLSHAGQAFDVAAYQDFLSDIGYLVAEPAPFQISTENVDAEVARMAGPQLVVPLMNARYALNAANARWGSLYDALYGTDAIASDDGAEALAQYNPRRGARVIQYAKQFLDQALPLADGSHAEAVEYQISNQQLAVRLQDGRMVMLQQPEAFVGYAGALAQPSLLLCRHHQLHIEIQLDRSHAIGQQDSAGIKDIVLESALTTIQDCEDSIAAVDSADKVQVYRNWLGLMRGDLSETLEKHGRTVIRTLADDRRYVARHGEPLCLPGRSLQFIRNVGLLMYSDAVLSPEGQQVPEGILDGIITSLIALYDVRSLGRYRNSARGSIYIVKPKMHGPEEVQFSNELFAAIEQLLNLPENTLKMGIMDEERRTSVNLAACLYQARQRVVFINTGFLDRTGDEIHSCMLAGAMVRKEDMKQQRWMQAYEARNVNIGLRCGLFGKAQIGKGMWATPDLMAAMLRDKIAHPLSGASCAWVPSPTAATLHVLHYHQVDVAAVQQQLLQHLTASTTNNDDSLTQLLTPPLLPATAQLSENEIQAELDNNVQGLLGYVVRWVEQGIGCSKVPDIDNIGRMEDRATLRISSQHLCNWLHHGLLTRQQVLTSLQRMAKVVDEQNADEPGYRPMSPNFAESLAFQAACDLIFKGQQQPNGYTEPLLHQSRQSVKALLQSATSDSNKR